LPPIRKRIILLFVVISGSLKSRIPADVINFSRSWEQSLVDSWSISLASEVVRPVGSGQQRALNSLLEKAYRGHKRELSQRGHGAVIFLSKKLHVFGRSGTLFYGISAIDIAL
jgi:hypothetical protein